MQKYVIVRTCRNVNRKTILHRDLEDLEFVRKLTLSYKTTPRSMVFYDKQGNWIR